MGIFIKIIRVISWVLIPLGAALLAGPVMGLISTGDFGSNFNGSNPFFISEIIQSSIILVIFILIPILLLSFVHQPNAAKNFKRDYWKICSVIFGEYALDK
jgi:hypothetical protein